MSKFNTTGVTAARTATGPIVASPVATSTTYEGAPAYLREPKSELFLAAVSSFLEDTFYEKNTDRVSRIKGLVRAVIKEDPEWVSQFAYWLRSEANLRSVSLVVALEGAKALLDFKMPGGKQLVASVLQRADEPGEALAYWHSTYGRKVPQPVKRGIANAAKRLYSERSLFKYDTPSHSIRFADVIQLTHPEPTTPRQSALFKFALDRRYNPKAEVPAVLSVATARAEVKSLSGAELRRLADTGELAEYIRKSGMTWEALSSVIDGGMDAKAWEAVIPSMGYMALLRNLRNFIQAGVSKTTLKSVADRIADTEEIAKSKQLPFRFLSAYNAVKNSTIFMHPLEEALEASLANVPALKGNTLILVDRSGSMFWAMSDKSEMTNADAAALFGSALALRAEKATLVQYGTSSNEISFNKGDSVLPMIRKFGDLGGTNTAATLRHWYKRGYDRVIVLTDEQAHGWYGAIGNVSKAIPANVPMYTWNLVGYKGGSTESSPTRLTFGGLSDKSFEMIDLIERARSGVWPWLSAN